MHPRFPPRRALRANPSARSARPWSSPNAAGRSGTTAGPAATRSPPVEADPKTGALVRAVKMETLSPWNRFGLTDEIAVNEYVCPGCAHLLSVEVRRAGDPPLLDTELRISPERMPDAAE